MGQQSHSFPGGRAFGDGCAEHGGAQPFHTLGWLGQGQVAGGQRAELLLVPLASHGTLLSTSQPCQERRPCPGSGCQSPGLELVWGKGWRQDCDSLRDHSLPLPIRWPVWGESNNIWEIQFNSVQLPFIEHLLCARHCAGCWGHTQSHNTVGNCQVSAMGTKINFFGASNSPSAATVSRAGVGEEGLGEGGKEGRGKTEQGAG